MIRMRNLRKQMCRRVALLKFAVAVLVLYCVHIATRDYLENAVYNIVLLDTLNATFKKTPTSTSDKVRKGVTRQYANRSSRLKTGMVRRPVIYRAVKYKNFKNFCAPPIDDHAFNATSGTGSCRIPKLDPFHPHAMKLVKDVGVPLSCKTKKRATLSGGVLNISGADVTDASYRYITRPKMDDFSFKMSHSIPVTSFQNFSVPHEFIELLLKLQNGEELSEYIMQVVPRKEILSRPSPPSELDLNVLIIGIDSISNGQAQRKLTKSYNYIRDVLEGYIFMGHSVVGDGTTEQLAAFLTGKGEREYKESRRGEPNAEPVDNWNWIFKKAKAHGYVTSYCEDMPYVGTFQYRLLGFQDPPTDFYPRAFFLAADSAKHSNKNPHCYGSEKIYNYHLDLARKFYEQYPERKKFLFHFPADLSHNDFNSVQLMDNDLLQFLTEFNKKGYLNNTVLIVLGDHGARFGDFRQTVQGKLEERLPLFSMTFPKWFKHKYPNIEKNLKTNTRRLTSWFDVYATFNHIFQYPRKPESSKHARSLLTEIPLERSCKDANIPQHWCPCVQWSAVDSQHNHLHQAALTAIEHINELNSKEFLGAQKCSRLSLFRLNRAEVEMPATHVLRFRRSGRDGYEPEFSSSSVRAKDRCSYQISFVAFPSYGVFEASVHYVYGRFTVKGSISRINKYGDQPKCIGHLFPHLRKYCYCI